jgi:hypothetical protein
VSLSNYFVAGAAAESVVAGAAAESAGAGAATGAGAAAAVSVAGVSVLSLLPQEATKRPKERAKIPNFTNFMSL